LAFIGNKTRKNISAKPLSEIDVLPIPVEKMVLLYSNYTVYFKKLGYKNCPTTKVRSKGTVFNLKENETLIDMNRWDQVGKIYSAFIKIERSPRTKVNMFHAIVLLIQNSDQKHIENIFSVESIMSFIATLKERYLAGIKGKTLMQVQNSIKAILFEVNQELHHELKNYFLSLPNDTSSSEPYTDAEIKQIVTALYRVFNMYRKFALSNEIPSVHPLYDEELLKKNGNFNGGFTESSWKKKIQSGNSFDTWKNDLIKAAFFLTSFYTGANESALINLKFSDITAESFSETARGNYKLNTIKNRQAGKKNIIDIGFSKRSKEFFETWLILSKLLTESRSDYVFPKMIKGDVKQSLPSNISVTMNNTFKLLGFPLLSTQRFRKTKATLIMRATESVFAVAEGLNNTASTVSKHYSNGNPVTMEFSIAGALDVRHRTINGEGLTDAIRESAYHFSDPVREIFFINKGIEKPTILSNGLRCKAPFGDKAKKLKSSLLKSGLANKNNKVACHKFLECFGCEHHAVIAEVDDIWLLLSFKDIILETSCRPSINTLPTNTLTKIINTLESILERLKTDFFTNYTTAYNKYSFNAHPLWNDVTDLDTMMEVF